MGYQKGLAGVNEEFPLLELQQHIHEMIARRAPLQQTMGAIADWMGMLFPYASFSLMSYDAKSNTLSSISGNLLSPKISPPLQNIPVEPGNTPCADAAYFRAFSGTEDIAQDDFRETSLEGGFQACWSYPVLSPDDELLGVVAVHYRNPNCPTQQDKRKLKQAAALVALTLVRDRDTQDHKKLYEWHSALFNNHADSVYELDMEGRFQRGNAALEALSGYSESDLIGIHFRGLIDADSLAQTEAAFDASRNGETITFETKGVDARGKRVSLEITNFPVVIDNTIVGVWGICRDITERKRQIDELHLLERGIEASPNGLTMVDAQHPDRPLVFVNPAFTEITGYPADEVLGRNCRFLHGKNTDPEIIREIDEKLEAQKQVDVVVIDYRKDGTPFWNHLTVNPVLDDAGVCTHFIGTQQDVTHQREQEAKIAYQATHDLLTGLPNRSAFSDRMAKLFRACQLRSVPLAFLYLDLDGFKSINDGLGHPVGNQLLGEVANRIKTSIQHQKSLIGRLVGDEFGILLYDYRDSGQVIKVAEHILEELVRPFEVNDLVLHLSGSIGIAANDIELEQPHELMQHSDLALTHAKRKGRNTWQWYQGGGVKSTLDSVILRNELQKALENEEFTLHYQPLVDAVTGEIRSVEALVRWHHPVRGMVSPGDFIPLAEKTGQIIPLGKWVLKQACYEIAQLNISSERKLAVAVNISSLQFLRENFLSNVDEALKESGLPPEFLELEVTESVLLDGAEPVIALMNSLNKRGIRVAIDDFGTGFSSLSYLRDLPTHKVKLDRSFISKILTDRRTAAIVQGVITMAHHMDMAVVAEGIEELEEQNDLIRRNCDLLQGYRFSRPVPLDALAELPDRLPAGNVT